MPKSDEDSSGDPQTLQITAAQSPHIRGSATSFAQFGQYNRLVSLSGMKEG